MFFYLIPEESSGQGSSPSFFIGMVVFAVADALSCKKIFKKFKMSFFEYPVYIMSFPDGFTCFICPVVEFNRV